MNVRNLLRVTALLEGILALALLLVPGAPCVLLFGEAPSAALTFILARLGGAILLSLSLACWVASGDPGSRITTGVVKAMLLYNMIATVILLYARFGLEAYGVLLWVGVAVHIVLGAWCVVVLRSN